MTFDLTIRHGRITTSERTFDADIGVRDGRIAAIAEHLPAGVHDIDASGLWVLPGGIDSHVHLEERSGMGLMGADDFYSGTVSAAFGGTTTVIPFAAQHKGQQVAQVLADYHALARSKAVIDYGFHLILSEARPDLLQRELPQAIAEGISSVKVYMTYEAQKLSDYELLDVMETCGREGALLMVHAENHDMIRWLTQRLLARGHTAPRFHSTAHDHLAEGEASYRAIALSRLLDVPILLVHVSASEAIEVIRSSQRLGSKVHAETCPQYLFLTADDVEQNGLEAAKYCCSPPPRDARAQAAVWQGLLDGTLALYSSDHAPYTFDTRGKFPHGAATTFAEMANGVPGIELRLPLLFSEGVMTGRLTPEQFVRLSATNHAHMYGLAHCKGDIAVGLDADIALWNPQAQRTIRWTQLHDQVGYTPYEGRQITGWPETVISRGRVVVHHQQLHAAPGSGQFIARQCPAPVLHNAQQAKPSRAARWLGLQGKAWTAAT